MSVSTADKKEIANIWLGAYPSLYPYTQDKLYMVLGSFVMGIEIIKLPRVNDYRPHFVLYPLYGNLSGNKLKDCMNYPVLLLEFFNKKGLQYSIPYKNSSTLAQEVIKAVAQQLPFKIGGDVKVSSIHKLIDAQINSKLVKMQLKQPEFFEVKFYSALYVSEAEAEKVLKQIQKESKSLDMKQFKTYYGDFDIWYDTLVKTKRDKFIAVIEKNKSDKKLEKLPVSELK
nr:hypothetical protein [uncultured Draconibacterium sp.]